MPMNVAGISERINATANDVVRTSNVVALAKAAVISSNFLKMKSTVVPLTAVQTQMFAKVRWKFLRVSSK